MTETIDEFNIVVDEVSLNNSWRKTTSGIAKGRDSTGTMKNAAVEFVIEGNDEEDLAEKIRLTEREFNKENPRAYGYRTADGTDGVNRIFDYHTGDGESVGVYSNVSELNEAHTRFSRYMMLEITCDLTVKTPDVVPQPGGQTADIDGLVEPMEIVEVYETGNWQTKSITGKFTFDTGDNSVGPFTINSVAKQASGDYEGRAKFTLGSAPTGLSVGDYAIVIGTTFYNGKFAVLDISGSDVVLAVDYTQDESPGGASLTGGTVTTAKEQYEAAYDTIKGLIDVSASESKDITLVHKVEQELSDGTFEFALTSQEQEFIPGGKGDGDTQLVRAIQMKVGKAQVKEWEVDTSELSFAGASTTPPKAVEASGVVRLNKEAITDTLEEHWENDIKAAVISQIEDHINVAAGQFEESMTDVVFNGTQPSIAFVIQGYEDFDGVIRVERIETVQTPHDAYIYPKGNGLHGRQTPDVEDIPVLTRQLTRVGKTEIDFSSWSAPTEAGYTFHLHDENETTRGPLDLEGIGQDLYIQTKTEIYFKLKLS